MNPERTPAAVEDDEVFDDGLCPDSNEHPISECPIHRCPNWITDLEALAPWGTSRSGLKEWAEG